MATAIEHICLDDLEIHVDEFQERSVREGDKTRRIWEVEFDVFGEAWDKVSEVLAKRELMLSFAKTK